MIETLKSGGILIIPILICGVLATFIIIERCIYFANIKKRDVKLMSNVNSSLAVGDFEACAVACTEADTPMAQVIKKAIDCRRYEERDIRPCFAGWCNRRSSCYYCCRFECFNSICNFP